MQCSKLRLNVCHKRETSWPKRFFTAVISFTGKLVLILGKSIYVYGCLDKKEMANKITTRLIISHKRNFVNLI